MTKKKAEQIVAGIDLNKVIKNYIKAEFHVEEKWYESYSPFFDRISCECKDKLEERKDHFKGLAKGGLNMLYGAGVITAGSIIIANIALGFAWHFVVAMLIGLGAFYTLGAGIYTLCKAMDPVGLYQIESQLGLTSKEVKALIKTGMLEKIMTNEKIAKLRGTYMAGTREMEKTEEEIDIEKRKAKREISSYVEGEVETEKRDPNLIIKLTQELEEKLSPLQTKVEETKKANEELLDSVDLSEFSL